MAKRLSRVRSQDRNAQCACGSGRKYKRCCGKAWTKLRRVRSPRAYDGQIDLSDVVGSAGLANACSLLLSHGIATLPVYVLYHSGTLLSADTAKFISAKEQARFSRCIEQWQGMSVAERQAWQDGLLNQGRYNLALTSVDK